MVNDPYLFDVFISYSQKDKTAVARLIERLRADGFRLWVDEEQMGGGDPLRETMVKGIVQSRHVICCLSSDYSESKWGTFESAVNQALDPDNRERRLIPVQIAPVLIPAEYRWLYCPDLTNPATWEEEYQKTIKHLRAYILTNISPKPEVSLVSQPRSLRPLPLIDRPKAFASPSPRLKALGFLYDPFAYLEAEKVPPEIWEDVFVAHPGFDEHIMNLSRSAVLLAPRGGGKSAGRMRLGTALNERRRKTFDGQPPEDDLPRAPLVVTYNNFERILERLPNVGLSDHIKPLMAAIAEAVYAVIQEYASRFMALQDDVRGWWWAFLKEYLEGETLESRVQGTSLASDRQRTPIHQSPFRPDSTLVGILESLQRRLTTFGFDGLIFLVDGVDGYLETQSLTNLEALVAPLLNSLPVLSLSGVVWKFFLPDTLTGAVHHSSGFETWRLNIVYIRRDENSLQALLRLWLAWASDGGIQDIRQVCTQELVSMIDVEEELAQLSLQHRLGPPRAVLALGHELFRGTGALISLTDWKNFRERVQKDLRPELVQQDYKTMDNGAQEDYTEVRGKQ